MWTELVGVQVTQKKGFPIASNFTILIKPCSIQALKRREIIVYRNLNDIFCIIHPSFSVLHIIILHILCAILLFWWFYSLL